MLEELLDPDMIEPGKEVTDVSVEYPVHLLRLDPDSKRIERIVRAAPWSESVGVGWPGASQPPAPTDPDITVSRYSAPLTHRSERANPLPLGEEARCPLEHLVPPPREPLEGP